MPEIKKILEPVSCWLTYELQPTDYLSEPRLKFRLRFIDMLEAVDELTFHGMSDIKAARALGLLAVAEWDLTTDGGKPIAVTDENKAKYLRPLLSCMLVPDEEEKKKAKAEKREPFGRPLAYALAKDAQDKRHFLKN